MNELSPRRVAWGLFLLRLNGRLGLPLGRHSEIPFSAALVAGRFAKIGILAPRGTDGLLHAPWRSSRDAVPAPSRRNK